EKELARAAAPRGHRDAPAALRALSGGALAEDQRGDADEDREGDDGEVDGGGFHLASSRVSRPSQPEKGSSAPVSSVSDPDGEPPPPLSSRARRSAVGRVLAS